MAKYAATRAEAPKPTRVVIVPPEAFAQGWAERPAHGLAVGLRRLCDLDLQVARAEAARFVSQAFSRTDGDGLTNEDAAIDAYNDALMRHAVARCTTDPNDATRPFFRAAEDTVKIALTSEGVARIWDEYVLMTRATGVDFPEADDEQLCRLGRALKAGIVAQLEDGKRAELRKIAGWMLTQLEGAGLALPPEEEDEEVSVYRVRMMG